MINRTPLEIAVELSYYVGRLMDIATHPEIRENGAPSNYEDDLVIRYADLHRPDPRPLVSGQVSGIVKGLFEEVAGHPHIKEDETAQRSLRNSFTTLGMIMKLEDPADRGFAPRVNHFSNMRDPLAADMPVINRIAQELKIDS